MTRRATPRIEAARPDVPRETPRPRLTSAPGRREIVRNAANDSATIRIYGDIGTSWWGDATSAKSFADELDSLGNVGHIDLHVNSPGGDAFDGVAIYNALADHPAKVTVHVDGLAASAASVIAMAGDEIVMGRGAELMIHDASGLAWGNPAEMVKMAETLDHISNSIAAVYADRAGGTAEEWREAMRAESWYNSDEAVEAGLAHRVARKQDDAAPTPPADGGDTPEDRAVDARAEHDLRVFHYRGRREAPAPLKPAASARGKTNERIEPVSDAQIAALREALGAQPTASADELITQVREVVSALAEAPLDETPQNAARTPELPEGVVAIDQTVLNQLREQAQAGVEAQARAAREHREQVVAEALRTGRISAARRQAWLDKLEADPEEESTLMSLQAGLVPVTELGHDDGSVEDSTHTSPDAVREDPAYLSWKV